MKKSLILSLILFFAGYSIIGMDLDPKLPIYSEEKKQQELQKNDDQKKLEINDVPREVNASIAQFMFKDLLCEIKNSPGVLKHTLGENLINFVIGKSNLIVVFPFSIESWDIASGKCVKEIKVEEKIEQIFFNKDNSLFAFITKKEWIYILSKDGECIHKLHSNWRNIDDIDMSFSEDNSLLGISDNSRGRVQIWNIKNEHLIKNRDFEEHKKKYSFLVRFKDNNSVFLKVFVAFSPSLLKLWNFKTDQLFDYEDDKNHNDKCKCNICFTPRIGHNKYKFKIDMDKKKVEIYDIQVRNMLLNWLRFSKNKCKASHPTIEQAVVVNSLYRAIKAGKKIELSAQDIKVLEQIPADICDILFYYLTENQNQIKQRKIYKEKLKNHIKLVKSVSEACKPSIQKDEEELREIENLRNEMGRETELSSKRCCPSCVIL